MPVKKPNSESEQAIRKKVTEDLRRAAKSLTEIGDHGTAAQLQPIIGRLAKRRAEDQARHKANQSA